MGPVGTLRTLRRQKDIAYLFAVGKRVKLGAATVVAAPSADGSPAYVFIAGRKAGGPVERNRARRRLRAVLGGLAEKVAPGWWIALIAQPEAARVDFATLSRELEAGLGRLGVLKDTD